MPDEVPTGEITTETTQPAEIQAAVLLNEAEVELAKAGTARHAATSAAIETWFTDHFNNVPVGWDTAMRNHVRSATDDLKTRLAAL